MADDDQRNYLSDLLRKKKLIGNPEPDCCSAIKIPSSGRLLKSLGLFRALY